MESAESERLDNGVIKITAEYLTVLPLTKVSKDIFSGVIISKHKFEPDKSST